MPVKIPWELMRESIRSFVHDSMNALEDFNPGFYMARIVSKNPEIAVLERESLRIVRGFHAITKKFQAFRDSEDEPRNLAAKLSEYRREFVEANKRIDSLAARLENFMKINHGKLDEKTVHWLTRARSSMRAYRERFPPGQFGKLPKPKLRAMNIHDFLRDFSQERLVDREGNPVQVVLRGKDLGNVVFDPSFLYRGVHNLVTDALNHTPGRPILVTLSRKNGHVAIDVTNKGPKLKPEEIRKIGWVRFTRAMRDPKRGYGKISTRLLTEAQGGSFRAGNSRIGPMLSIHLSAVRRK